MKASGLWFLGVITVGIPYIILDALSDIEERGELYMPELDVTSFILMGAGVIIGWFMINQLDKRYEVKKRDGT